MCYGVADPRLVGSPRPIVSHRGTVSLLTALLIALCLAAASARAQEPAGSDSERAGDGVLQEIIVTAQYREQALQRTSLAITAIEADEIVARGMADVLDVASAAPNVTMTLGSDASGNSNQAFIRAIGRQDSDFAFEPRVSFYIDDVYHSTVFGSVFNLLDVERIEVLRGPQGTLFGRNTVGGAVRIITRKPEGDGKGYLRATVGSFDRLDMMGAIDVGLVPDVLFLRLSAGRQQRTGHVDRLNFPCVHPSLGGNLPVAGLDNGCQVGTLGGIDLKNVRAESRWIINQDAETTLAFEYLDDDREPPGAPLTALSLVTEFPGLVPGVPNGLALWLETIGVPAYDLTVNQALIDALRPSDVFQSYAIFGNPGLADPLSELVNTPANSLDSWSVSNVLDWQLSDAIGFKSITAYREFDGETGRSVMALPITEIHYLTGHRQFSQEFQLSGSALDGSLDWIVGVFYLDSSNHFDGRVQLEGFAVYFPPDFAILANVDFFADDHLTLENRSVFAHTVWHATDKFNVTMGARYSGETKGYRYFRQNVGEPPNLVASAPDTSISEVNPKLALDYQWTPDMLAYVSYSTGFTAGGFNPRPFTPADAELSFDTENVASYEIGLKSEWLGHRLRINAAVFFTEFDDVQLLVTGCPVGCRTNSPFYYDNAGDSEIRGLEVEFTASPIEHLMISGYIGHQKARFVRFNEDAFPIDATLESPTFKVPEWNFGLSMQYEVDLGAGGILTPRVDATFRSTAYFGSDRETEELRQHGFALVNGRIAWQLPDERWSGTLSVTNLTDEAYFENMVDRRNVLGYAQGQVGRPHEWSASVTYRF